MSSVTLCRWGNWVIHLWDLSWKMNGELLIENSLTLPEVSHPRYSMTKRN